MFSKVLSSALHGVDAHLVEVEVYVSGYDQPMVIVGLPDTAVRESKDRVLSAMSTCGYGVCPKGITINLAPADVRKMGSAYDLAIAVGLLKANGDLPEDSAEGFCLLGELALDGRLRPVRGALAAADMVRDRGLRGMVVPERNACEAAMVQGVSVYGVRSLPEAIRFFRGAAVLEPVQVDPHASLRANGRHRVDFSEVKGQEHVKRALEVAAAGGHNVLMIGPPGSGKTLMARRLPTILPDFTLAEALETTKIHSTAGLLNGKEGLVGVRPFRAPHHTISDAGLIGGGSYPLPGEVSLAHNGVLFLDELPEFRRNVLEVLRQPLEDGHVTIARAAATITYPARFILVGAMNPCPCGYLGSRERSCNCSDTWIQRYRSRISGPLLDRIDLHVEVDAVAWQDLRSTRVAECSAAIRKRVCAARERQTARFAGSPYRCNAQMPHSLLSKHCHLDESCVRLLEQAVERLGLSARAHDRILRVARTIADLEAAEAVRPEHLAEAIQYRTLDRRFDPSEAERRKAAAGPRW
jgi:magnesium chelatase family protein